MTRLPRCDAASSSTFGILGAMMLMAFSISFVYTTLESPVPEVENDAQMQEDAKRLLTFLLQSPGVDGAGAWTTHPDTARVFGLASEREPGRVDAARIGALQGGSIAAAPNGVIDYAEAKAALAVEGYDFHLRTRPVLLSRDDAASSRLDVGGLAYFGRMETRTVGADASVALGLAGSEVNVTVTLTGRGSVPGAYGAIVELGDPATGRVLAAQARYTGLLAPGETQRVWATFPGLIRWDPQLAVRVRLVDAEGAPALNASGSPTPSPWMPIQTMPLRPLGLYNHLVEAVQPHVAPGGVVSFRIDHYDGSGSHVPAAKARLRLHGPDGRVLDDVRVNLPLKAGAAHVYTCGVCSQPGTYTLVALEETTGARQLDQVNVSVLPAALPRAELSPVAAREVALLDGLVADFTPRLRGRNATGGDVFPDTSEGAALLVDALRSVRVVVIGTDVAEHALSPAAVKEAIDRWVREGGTLIVHGNPRTPSRWLESLQGLGLSKTTNATTWDPAHPLLSWPEPLAPGRYLTGGRAWDIPPGASFESVVSAGAGPGGGSLGALALSRAGSLGQGTILVTSYSPGALTSPQDDAEAQRLMHNMIVHARWRLWTDMGPPIPDGVPVASVSRLVLAESEGATVPVRVTLSVFR